jgi:hypothetical protein
MSSSRLFAVVAILSSLSATPVLAQAVIQNPGYCAFYYPNANCQNKGPGNPYGNYRAIPMATISNPVSKRMIGQAAKPSPWHRSDCAPTTDPVLPRRACSNAAIALRPPLKAAKVSRAGGPCHPRKSPAPETGQIPDSPAAFLDSAKAYPALGAVSGQHHTA